MYRNSNYDVLKLLKEEKIEGKHGPDDIHQLQFILLMAEIVANLKWGRHP